MVEAAFGEVAARQGSEAGRVTSAWTMRGKSAAGGCGAEIVRQAAILRDLIRMLQLGFA